MSQKNRAVGSEGGEVTVVFKRTGENRGLTVSSMLSRTRTEEEEELVVYRQTRTDSENMKVWLVFQSTMNQSPQTYHFSEVVVDYDHTG